jgi:hypothetical protein
VHEMIELIGEVVSHVLDDFQDPDYLHEVWGVSRDEDLRSVLDHKQQVIDEIAQRPLF